MNFGQQSVEGFGCRVPAEGFSRSRIKGVRDRVQLSAAVSTQVGTFWEVLPQQAIGVFGRAALSRALRIAEVNMQPGIEVQPGMLGHLSALIPSERLA